MDGHPKHPLRANQPGGRFDERWDCTEGSTVIHFDTEPPNDEGSRVIGGFRQWFLPPLSFFPSRSSVSSSHALSEKWPCARGPPICSEQADVFSKEGQSDDEQSTGGHAPIQVPGMDAHRLH